MVEIPGFVDHHVHLLRVAAGARPPYDLADPASIAAFHRDIAARGSSPMDQPPEPSADGPLDERIAAGLRMAAAAGIVQITEAGVVDPRHLDALTALRDQGPLPLRVRVLLASGLAEAEPSRLRRTGDAWFDVVGVKFYADGWLGPGTCALCDPFSDPGDDLGVLFQDAAELARRITPAADAGFTVATHAIGDRAIEAVLDAYDAVFGDDCSAAAPRIEHAQVMQPELIERMAAMGVVACIQPSFAVSDSATAVRRLGRQRAAMSYRWDLMDAAGVRMISGSDFPIEPIEPLTGFQHLVTGKPLDAVPNADAVAVVLPADRVLELMTDGSVGTTTLAADPRSVDPSDIAAIPVLRTTIA